MSATDATAADETGLSVDEAVELMTGERPEDEAFEPDADEGEAESPEDEGDDPLAPPHFWAAQDKAAFEALPRHLQETVLAYERNRDTAAARTIQEAAEARNLAERAASETGELVARLDKLVPEAEAAFGHRWPGPIDWSVLAEEVGAEEAARLKLQHDQELEGLQRLNAAKQEAETVAFQNFVVSEFEKLKQIEPDLADPRRGAERRGEVVKFLADNGVPLEQIRHAGAVEFALAYDALRFRQAKASFAHGDPTPPRSGRAVQPGAASGRSPTQQRQAGAKARFASKPSVDNAVAALLARG